MRGAWWVLLGVLLLGGARARAADARHSPDDPQAARFERLLKRRPNDSVLRYDLGTVQYRHDRYDKAAESLSAATASSNTFLQGRASYNLGNAHYRLGRAALQAAPTRAIDFYQRALEDYRLAIRQNPTDVDAKYNYEFVERRLRALKAQSARQSSGKARRQQANRQSSEAQHPNAHHAPDEQMQQQRQQAQIQRQQTGPSSASQQHAASTESTSQPQSTSTREASQEAEQRHQGAQRRIVQSPPAQPGSEPQNMSRQQALWILDALKNEERGALANEHRGSARDADVEQDW